MTQPTDVHIKQRQVLSELKSKYAVDVTDTLELDLGKWIINGESYSVQYSYKGKGDDSGKELSFNEKLYKHVSKTLTASMISMYFGKVDVNSVTLSLIGYTFGETIFPILVTNQSLRYLYNYF